MGPGVQKPFKTLYKNSKTHDSVDPLYPRHDPSPAAVFATDHPPHGHNLSLEMRHPELASQHLCLPSQRCDVARPALAKPTGSRLQPSAAPQPSPWE